MLGIIKIYKRQIEEANWIKLKLQIDKLPNSSICRIKIMVSQLQMALILKGSMALNNEEWGKMSVPPYTLAI